MEPPPPARRPYGAVNVVGCVALAFGIVGAIAGGLGLLVVALNAVMTATMGAPFDHHPARVVFQFVEMGLAVFGIVVGVRIWRLTPGARQLGVSLGLAKGAAALANALMTMLIDFPFFVAQWRAGGFAPMMPPITPELESMAWISALLTTIALTLLSLILPFCLLYFLTRDDAYHQFGER